MEIKRSAIAGTLESSDAQVLIEPAAEGVEIDLVSSVMNQYGRQIRQVVLETLERLDIKNVHVSVTDKGALDCTLKARVEAAAFRAVDQMNDIPW